jgi:Clp amino terminal domain, pathogenicity island component
MVLRAATAIAFERGVDYIGTEHVLFVLAGDPGAPARLVLKHLRVNFADIKRELGRCLTIAPLKRRRGRRRVECCCSFCGTAETPRFVHLSLRVDLPDLRPSRARHHQRTTTPMTPPSTMAMAPRW